MCAISRGALWAFGQSPSRPWLLVVSASGKPLANWAPVQAVLGCKIVDDARAIAEQRAVKSDHVRLIDAASPAAVIARAGTTAAEVCHAMDEIVTGRAGGLDAGRLGHGLGLQLTEGLSFMIIRR